ncbi:hypothetical protein DFQ01_1102 [Paenibacillus cellulosilyticus]|uniref:Restriction endonuclease n=1 Tax=Paenibacillus cellulosilyticus TaxID=375489 RepID=A0A2V2YS67_9BACL|nr:hypothetical protein DFQ01_1102 [Paenibacillus cellulosilyticus]
MVSKPEERKTHTYQDWLTWDGSWELINGKAYNMLPAPNSLHQFIVGELHFSLRTFFQNRSCFVFVAPFDVFLVKAVSMTRLIISRSRIYRLYAVRTKWQRTAVRAPRPSLLRFCLQRLL